MKKIFILGCVFITINVFSQINSPNGNNFFIYNGSADVTLIVLVSNPTAETLIVKGGFEEVVNLNVPSKSVETPPEPPTIVTLAPGIDCLLLSVTEPVIVFCAKEIPLKNNIISKYTFIWVSFWLVYLAKIQIILISIKKC